MMNQSRSANNQLSKEDPKKVDLLHPIMPPCPSKGTSTPHHSLIQFEICPISCVFFSFSVLSSLALLLYIYRMALTSIINESGETIVGHLLEKSNDKIILIVHGEQGKLLGNSGGVFVEIHVEISQNRT